MILEVTSHNAVIFKRAYCGASFLSRSRHLVALSSMKGETTFGLLLFLREFFLGLVPRQDLAIAVAHHLEVLEHARASNLVRLTQGKAHTVNRSLDGSVHHLKNPRQGIRALRMNLLLPI